MFDPKERRNLLAMRLGGIFAFLHAVASVVAWVERAVAKSVNSSDVGDGGKLVRALGQPMLAVHDWLIGKEPGAAGALLLPFLVANSVLWGLVVAAAARVLVLRRVGVGKRSSVP